MNAAAEDRRRSPLRRLIRLASAAGWLFVAAWLIWVMATRWNGVPADPSPIKLTSGSLPIAPVDPELDRTREILDALAALPPLPQMILPTPPEGMNWVSGSYWNDSSDMSDALRGDWTPASRPNLQRVIQYLKSPDVEQALEQLAAVKIGACRLGATGIVDFWLAITTLIADARYRCAEVKNIDAALDDLEIVYRISATLRESPDERESRTARSGQGFADEELGRLAFENTLTRDQATRMISIRRRLGLSPEEAWTKAATRRRDALTQVMDCTYSNDGNGDGWLVLSSLDSVLQAQSSLEERAGAWNVLSLFFSPRRAVANKIEASRATYASVGRLPYEQALRLLKAPTTGCPFLITDGPMTIGNDSNLIIIRTYDAGIRGAAYQSAANASLALSAYRHDHGEYPPTIESLVGGYLPDEGSIRDPYCNRPLRYNRTKDGQDFVLYAVGPNQQDDGGRQVSGIRAFVSGRPPGDLIFEHTRDRPEMEPKLEINMP